MSDLVFSGIADIIHFANGRGIKFSLHNGHLIVKKPKGCNVELKLIEILRKNKYEIEEYFKSHTSDSNIVIEEPTEGIIFQNTKYYKVTANQAYWLNDEVDHEYKSNDSIHGTIKFSLNIKGNLVIDQLQKTIEHLINRHESLRCTFHLILGNYYMRVENPELFSKVGDIKNFDDEKIYQDKGTVSNYINFEDHVTSISNGPLFLVRLVQLHKQSFVVGFKLHHVIADTISIEILLKEMFKIYRSFLLNVMPSLPVLPYQYKEVLALLNTRRKAAYTSNRAFWEQSYDSLPPNLTLPYSNGSSRYYWERVVGKVSLIFNDFCLKRLLSICKSYSTSLFIVLQASFINFLFEKTGQNDIMFGISTFGRELPIFENQIGFFSKVVFIRILMSFDDSFYQILKKTKQSNQESNDYSDFPLIEFIDEQLKVAERSLSDFWKFNIHFYDTKSKNVLTDIAVSELQVIFNPPQENNITPIDLQVYFKYSGDLLKFDVHYDTSKFTKISIDNLFDSYIKSISNL